MAPSQCPFINSSHFGRAEYEKPNRWSQCGQIMPEHGAAWRHNFDAYQKGKRGYGCHLIYPQMMSKKQHSRVILEKW
ncbi:MAG: hypothetical protein LBR43_00200 [Spiroplasmataceae bacterium]|nr:hypothetical protein [Spiroplasmataceae bacterium]